MIRVNNRAIFIGRALLNTTTTVSGGATINQVAPFATCSSSNHQSHNLVARFGLSNPFLAQYSSVAATSLAQDNGFNPKEVVLFQYEACPFCNKVKAFLDYYDLPYKVVEVNPMNKKEIKWSDYKKVPILTVDSEQLVDSSDIINKLVIKIRPDYELNADEEKKWREWVDNHLVHVLSPNIYRTVAEALESFEYITTKGNFSLYERLVAKYGGAAAMYFVSKKLKKRHNITDERAALYGAAEQWVDALNGRKFLGGSNPNLADLAAFGVLRPIRHLKSGKDMVEHTRIGKWFSEMESAVGQSSRVIGNN
ncbi:PREDICTED: prostaglandin E synthase 2-like isoform X2 [Lupinus angustifolius]|uniref:prostaglandin E synthase 2-like isoform X2 n=1 Tax=Lupinus angustifolius TaxID=3871 RepID=UPI00092E377D|nr:PREDICTED: prostaglandin E synthase 2-like isoform X2 [Lupinus angustifolius]